MPHLGATIVTKRRFTTALAVRVVNPLVRTAASAGVAPPWIAILETTGRRSGEPRHTPVGNGLEGDTFWIVAEHGRRAAYVRNIEAHPRVRVKVAGVWRTGSAQLLDDDDPRERQRRIGRKLNAAVVRAMGTDLLSVRIDLDPLDTDQRGPRPTDGPAEVLSDGLVAGAFAAVLAGLPSTVEALLRRTDPLEATVAAGSILLPAERRRARLLAAAVPVHLTLSLGWAVLLARVLPRRATVGAAAAGPRDRRARPGARRAEISAHPRTTVAYADSRPPRLWGGGGLHRRQPKNSASKGAAGRPRDGVRHRPAPRTRLVTRRSSPEQHGSAAAFAGDPTYDSTSAAKRVGR